jgi:8-oxo-dGTP pyrophosphatase MutT (NUDIX family)
MIIIESFGVIPLMQQEGEWKVLLILHKEGNHWSFPKGRANPGESALETATRELKEETGLTVEKVLLAEPFSERYQFRRRGAPVLKTVHYFPALVSGVLQLQEEEIRDAKWINIREALPLLSFKEARHILEELIKFLKL